jgi:alpha,alpha-trehalase
MSRRFLTVLALLLCLGTRRADAAPVDDYIHHAWTTLTRSVLSPGAYADSKVGSPPVLFLPAGMPEPPALASLRQQVHLAVRHLPRPIVHLGDVQPTELGQNGLLYLPHPYVVPGGMFNEMYGWDSYFIMRGLLLDGQVPLARGMLDNYLFEIEHYGAILNANRSYYLTRSQPPFLTSAIRAVYTAQHLDTTWLAHAYDVAVRDYRMWTAAPNLAGDTGLSRYFDTGTGPVPEMKADNAYYAGVVSWALLHPGQCDYVRTAPGEVSHSPVFHLSVAQDKTATSTQSVFLTDDYFLGDRAMRASGYDVSFRFGPFSGATHHFAPVCLNSLLYKTETDLEWMAHTLGHDDAAAQFQAAAARRRAAVDKYLWNADAGLYFDYDTVAGRQSTYHYATTFFPLWAGLASPAQAAAVATHLSLFEQPGGLAMSDVESGAQWDKPFGWAPVNLLAVEGLWQTGDHVDAARLATKFDTTVETNFNREHTIREKYNMVTGSSAVTIKVGYTQNVLGFGWTNAVYLALKQYVHP